MSPDANELQELVRELHRQGSPWVPCGLGSRLDWGPPLQDGLPLSCARLRGIVEHNPGDFTISVRAGTPLLEVQAALAPHRQWLAVDQPWGSQRRGAGSLGGLVARGLAGGYRQRYLGIRDQLIGLSLLGAEGTGLRQLTRKTCDELVRLPMMGAVESLNVSVASGICLYEALRQCSQRAG